MISLKKVRFIVVLIICIIWTVQFAGHAEAKPLEVSWSNAYNRGEAELSLPEDNRVNSFFTVSGWVDAKYHAVLVTATCNKEKVHYYFPVHNQTVSGEVYLRFGKGVYQIELGLVKPSPTPSVIKFTRAGSFVIENTGSDDLRFLAPSWGIESNSVEIVSLAREITKGISGDYEKLRAIHDWVSKNINYDVDRYRQNKIYEIRGAVETLRSRKGLCRDYSNLTTALLRAAGIEARTVIGKAKVEGKWVGHAWTEAKIADRWVFLDTTWDAGSIKNGKFISRFSRQYFDRPAAKLAETHLKIEETY